jgi:hypothetical protein
VFLKPSCCARRRRSSRPGCCEDVILEYNTFNDRWFFVKVNVFVDVVKFEKRTVTFMTAKLLDFIAVDGLNLHGDRTRRCAEVIHFEILELKIERHFIVLVYQNVDCAVDV